MLSSNIQVVQWKTEFSLVWEESHMFVKADPVAYYTNHACRHLYTSGQIGHELHQSMLDYRLSTEAICTQTIVIAKSGTRAPSTYTASSLAVQIHMLSPSFMEPLGHVLWKWSNVSGLWRLSSLTWVDWLLLRFLRRLAASSEIGRRVLPPLPLSSLSTFSMMNLFLAWKRDRKMTTLRKVQWHHV